MEAPTVRKNWMTWTKIDESYDLIINPETDTISWSDSHSQSECQYQDCDRLTLHSAPIGDINWKSLPLMERNEITELMPWQCPSKLSIGILFIQVITTEISIEHAQ